MRSLLSSLCLLCFVLFFTKHAFCIPGGKVSSLAKKIRSAPSPSSVPQSVPVRQSLASAALPSKSSFKNKSSQKSRNPKKRVRFADEVLAFDVGMQPLNENYSLPSSSDEEKPSSSSVVADREKNYSRQNRKNKKKKTTMMAAQQAIEDSAVIEASPLSSLILFSLFVVLLSFFII